MPQKPYRYRVTSAPASSDGEPHQILLRVSGAGVDNTFKQMDRIAALCEAALNAAENYAVRGLTDLVT